jgi:hypothetical protein
MGGGEVTLDQVRCPQRSGVGLGREPLAGPAGAPDAFPAHQPGDLIAAHVEAGLAGGLG